MNLQEQLEQFPRRVRHSTRLPALAYERLEGCFAIHGPVPESLPHAVRVRFTIDGGAITVCDGDPDELPLGAGTEVTPVYAARADAPPLVPTGIVHIRFRTSVAAEERCEPLSRLGFEIVEVPQYAPNTAWIRARSGHRSPALTQVDNLERVADVEDVEPEMVGAEEEGTD